MNTKYVKFLRGTPSAYAALEIKDNDTLYFISEPNSTVGKLYLGNILVAGNITPDGTSIIDSLSELIDVNLEGLKNKQILSYDENTKTWIPMDLPSAVAGNVMIGATSEKAGVAGYVPQPEIGDENKFLRGDGTWQAISGGTDLSHYVTKTELENINTNIANNTNEINNLSIKINSFQENLTWEDI